MTFFQFYDMFSKTLKNQFSICTKICKHFKENPSKKNLNLPLKRGDNGHRVLRDILNNLASSSTHLSEPIKTFEYTLSETSSKMHCSFLSIVILLQWPRMNRPDDNKTVSRSRPVTIDATSEEKDVIEGADFSRHSPKIVYLLSKRKYCLAGGGMTRGNAQIAEQKSSSMDRG